MKNKALQIANEKILIIGGYGQVGRQIAEQLASRFPNSIVVAGRDARRAAKAADEIGFGTNSLRIDIFSENAADALEGVALAVVCIDQVNTRFVEQCFARNIHYVDISAKYSFLSQIEKLNELAIKQEVTAILSVGASPGLTNLLAAHAKEKMNTVDQIDIIIETGLGDLHGRAAMDWIFENLDTKFDVMKNGRPHSVCSFGESIRLRLPQQRVGRRAYRFNFSDQHVIPHTLNIPNVSTWIRFSSGIATWIFAKSAQMGLGRLLRRPYLRRVATWLFMNSHFGSDVCNIGVRATSYGSKRQTSQSLTIGIIGRKEALMTAIVAAETVHQMLTTPISPGVLHIEETIALDPIILALREKLPDLKCVL
jgi:saccharopine dehydrogenase-like NADP-dependent oxidoreductase